jgi:hypothetical protein
VIHHQRLIIKYLQFNLSSTNRTRGQHPNDRKLFSKKFLSDLREATHDLSILLTMGYPDKASLKLVGDRFRLTERQRMAVIRAACSDTNLSIRKAKELTASDLSYKTILIDGFNLLITLETALSGGLIFVGRDGSYRDLASVHGTYKRVTATQEAVELVGQFCQDKQVEKLIWHFDTPVSNSGRLKILLYDIAEKNGWNWEIILDYNPDKVLKEAKEGVVVSSDAMVLNECVEWVNLASEVLQQSDNIKKINL